MNPNLLLKTSAIAILTVGSQFINQPLNQTVLASHEISLADRYPVKSVSDVFKDNILLNLAYMNKKVAPGQKIDWADLEKPFHYQFKLDPNKTFAFHDDVLSQYQDKIAFTTNAHFNSQEGFKTDGYLFGDGVCHLASLMYWVAKDAGLDAKAPTNHDFMKIPEISRENGVSIYSNPYSKGSNAAQNLYITNNKNKPVKLVFDYSDEKLKFSVAEED